MTERPEQNAELMYAWGLQNEKHAMKASNTCLLSIGPTVLALIALQTTALAHSVESGLRECVAIADDEDRLRCFDALAADSEPPAPPAVAEPAAVAAAPPAAAAEAAPAAVPEAAPAAVPEAAPAAASEASPAAPEPAATPAVATTEAEPISDEIGRSSIKDRDPVEPKKYSARVTKCQENKQSGQYYFFFENGQVWKQSNYQRLRWRNCEFDVTVSKGTFGFDMYIPEKDRTVRVSRIR